MKRNEFLSKRDFYEQYWKCRDFEIKNLWQRSIFLGTFLVLSYTAYGAFFGKAFLENCFYANLHKWPLHVLADILALIGATFSVLWIAMAKGSKAWYECYEKAVTAIEKELVSTPCEKLYSGFGYRYRPFFGGIDLDNSIFSSKGGAYSPSKINIALGQLSFFIWTGIFSIHVALMSISFPFCNCGEFFYCSHTAVFIVLFVLDVLAFTSLFFVGIFPKVLGLFDVSSNGIGGNAKNNENLYHKNASALSILEKIFRQVEHKCGRLPFDCLGEDAFYLVYHLDGVYETSLKLDISVNGDRMCLCIKRNDNNKIAINDAIDKFLKNKFDGVIFNGGFVIKDKTGDDSFKLDEGIEKIIEIMKTFEIGN